MHCQYSCRHGALQRPRAGLRRPAAAPGDSTSRSANRSTMVTMLFPASRKCKNCQTPSPDAAVVLCPSCGAKLPELLPKTARTIIWMCLAVLVPITLVIKFADDDSIKNAAMIAGAVVGAVFFLTFMSGLVVIIVRQQTALKSKAKIRSK